MGTPEISPHQLARRLDELEDSVYEIRFQHMVKVDAMSSGVGVLYAQHKHLQHELTGFRAEATAHLTALKADIATLKTDMTEVKTDVTTLKTDTTQVKNDIADLKALVATEIAEVKGGIAEILRILDNRN
jgi:peptidoglycan hydrolase CwlO-like protein